MKRPKTTKVSEEIPVPAPTPEPALPPDALANIGQYVKGFNDGYDNACFNCARIILIGCLAYIGVKLILMGFETTA